MRCRSVSDLDASGTINTAEELNMLVVNLLTTLKIDYGHDVVIGALQQVDVSSSSWG